MNDAINNFLIIPAQSRYTSYIFIRVIIIMNETAKRPQEAACYTSQFLEVLFLRTLLIHGHVLF